MLFQKNKKTLFEENQKTLFGMGARTFEDEAAGRSHVQRAPTHHRARLRASGATLIASTGCDHLARRCSGLA